MRSNKKWLIGVLLCALPSVVGAQDETPNGALPEVSLAASPMTTSGIPAGDDSLAPAGGFRAVPPPPASVNSFAPEGDFSAAPTPPAGVAALKRGKKRGNASSIVTFNQIADEGSKKLAAGMVMGPPQTILPEVTTTIQLSSSDLNRIICSDGDFKEALTSDEKGLMIKITGKDAFLKFKVAKRNDGKLSYSTTPTEIYMVCGNSTYSMVAFPSRMPSQTIKLASGVENKMKENQALYAGLPFEKRIIRAIKEIYTDTIPESYTVVRYNKADLSWKGLVVVLKREVSIEGEGMRVKEYHVSLKAGQEPFKLSEKMFLRKDFAHNPIGISIDKHVLRPGNASRLFIVEQRPDKPLGGNGFQQLPMLDGGVASIAPETQSQAKQPLPVNLGKGLSLPRSNSPMQQIAAPGGHSEE